MPVEMWIPDELENGRKNATLVNDFFHYTTAEDFTTTASDSGSIATNATGLTGTITISPSDGTVGDNDETYLESTVRAFKFADDKNLLFYLEGVFTDVGTNNGNWILGFVEDVGANTLQDNGAGPPADYDGANFHKVDGGTNWLVEVSIGTTQSTKTTDITATSTSKQRFLIKCRMLTSTRMEASFWHAIGSTAPLKQCKDTDGNVIKLTATVSSNAAMNAVVGAKNGSTDHATIDVDFILAAVMR